MTVRPLAEADEGALVELLDRGLPADAYLLDCLENGGMAGFFGAFAGGRLLGAGMVRRGAACAAAATPAAVARVLAPSLAARGAWSSVVGPEEPCAAIVEELRGRGAFRVDRVQLFMSAARGDELGPGEPRLRAARPADLDGLVGLVAAYRVEDGLARSADDHGLWIRSHTRERIAEEQIFLLEEGGRIVFTGAFNFLGRHGAGLGGIYTVPDARGRGIASRGTAELCRIALNRGPFATLHVNRENAPAIAAYHRAGLHDAGVFRLTFR